MPIEQYIKERIELLKEMVKHYPEYDTAIEELQAVLLKIEELHELERTTN